MKKGGFTLLELMICVAIIAVVIFLILPIFSKTKCSQQSSQFSSSTNITEIRPLEKPDTPIIPVSPIVQSENEIALKEHLVEKMFEIDGVAFYIAHDTRRGWFNFSIVTNNETKVVFIQRRGETQ